VSTTRTRAGAAVLTGLVLFLAACAGNSALPAETQSPSIEATGGQNQAAGSFTVEFAKCMRAHGVPKFPDPNGQSGQLGPGSGIDPASARFQSAINGPCKSLAPAAWLGDGPANAVPGGK
jgi:hypothetical protein